MERTTETKPTKWKKEGGGSFHTTINGRVKIIKPGEVFTAKLEEIPVAFRDVLKAVEGTEEPVVATKKPEPEAKAEPTAEVKAAPLAESKYELQHRGGGYYNVVDQDGKAVNEKALRQDAAKELLNSLQ